MQRLRQEIIVACMVMSRSLDAQTTQQLFQGRIYVVKISAFQRPNVFCDRAFVAYILSHFRASYPLSRTFRFGGSIRFVQRTKMQLSFRCRCNRCFAQYRGSSACLCNWSIKSWLSELPEISLRNIFKNKLVSKR